MTENMDEIMSENSEQNPDNNEDVGPFRNLAQGIIKNESSLDLSSIMQMATNLLSSDLLMNSVAELGKNTESPSMTVPEVSDGANMASISEKLEKLTYDLSELKQTNSELASITMQLEKLTNKISELKKELLDIKEDNEYLTKYVKKLYYKKK